MARDEIMCRVDEDGSLALYDPYATIECETKEDFDHLVEMVEFAESVVRCKDCEYFPEYNEGVICSQTDRYPDPDEWCCWAKRRK
jgi:hypothetical protein